MKTYYRCSSQGHIGERCDGNTPIIHLRLRHNTITEGEFFFLLVQAFDEVCVSLEECPMLVKKRKTLKRRYFDAATVPCTTLAPLARGWRNRTPRDT